MIFSANISKMQSALERIMPALPKKSTLPVLEHALIELHEGLLSITATNQEITIRTSVNCFNDDMVDGQILVPARKILDIIKNIDDKDRLCVFEASPADRKLTLSIGTKIHYKFNCMDSDDYLDLTDYFNEPSNDPEAISISFRQGELQNILNSVGFAVSDDEFRPAMNGILFEMSKNKGLTAVATDSFKLAMIANDDINCSSEAMVILSSEGINALTKENRGSTMYVIKDTNGKPKRLRFEFDDSIIIIKVIDEKYPPYRNVIPDKSNIEVEVPIDDLLLAITRLEVVTGISNQIKLSFTANSLILYADNEELGNSGQEPIDISNQMDFEIRFNIRYLKESIQKFKAKAIHSVFFVMTEPTKPCLIHPAEQDDKEFYQILIMPVRM